MLVSTSETMTYVLSGRDYTFHNINLNQRQSSEKMKTREDTKDKNDIEKLTEEVTNSG